MKNQDEDTYKSYWCLSDITDWDLEEYIQCADFEMFCFRNDFNLEPAVVLGDEVQHISIHEHLVEDSFLFRLNLNNLKKMMFADDLPSMLILMEKLNNWIEGYFNLKIVMRELRDG